jgi:hypothetical protein
MIPVGYIYGAAAVAGSAILTFLAPKGSLLPGLLFWVAVVQGAVLLMAAAEIAHSNWHRRIRAVLLGVHPLLWMFPLAFLFFSFGKEIYPWAEHPTAWLQQPFFAIRNVALLLVTALGGTLFSRAAVRDAPATRTLAVLYVFLFVTTQTVIAFDWVMSFEFPWISTLLGAYFFVEAIYLGVALAAVLAAYLCRRYRDLMGKTLLDLATLLFGFSLLWVGQFFAQYLVIWYGNIPAEVSFLSKRVLASPLREMSLFVLLGLFAIPFVSLWARGPKETPWWVALMAGIVAAAVFVERLVFLVPVVELSAPVVILEMAILGGAVLLTAAAAVRKEMAGMTVVKGG